MNTNIRVALALFACASLLTIELSVSSSAFAQTPRPSASPCAMKSAAPRRPAAIPTNLPSLSDADVQAAIAAGTQAAKQILAHPPTPPPNLPTAPPNLSQCAAAGNLQDAIYRAAMAFVGTVTCNLHGAPGDEACMAAMNQILQNAGIAPIGPQPNGTNFIPDAILKYGNRLVEIPQSETVPGDLMVRHSPGDTYMSSRPGDTEHIAVCIVRGCGNVVSNSSSAGNPACPGVFGWFSDFTMCYRNSPYCGGTSQFYRVLP